MKMKNMGSIRLSLLCNSCCLLQAYDLFSPAELAAIAAPLVIVSLGYFEWSLFQDPVDDSKTAAVLIPPKISADGPPVNPSFMDTPGLEQRPSEAQP